MKRFGILLLVACSGSAVAQIATPADVPPETITNIRITTTATQANIQYISPDQRPCTIEVSESSSYAPLVHDVDPALFSGSNVDTRPGSASQGASKSVVIGKRSADMASDGRRYSRALQVSTKHYFRINNDGNCASGAVTGSFTTTNIPIGMTWQDPLLTDPSAPGVWVEPSVDWNNPDYTWTDPLTGLLTKRLTLPQSYFTATDPKAFTSAIDQTGSSACAAGAWKNPCGPAGGSGPATISGRTTPLLLKRTDAAVANMGGYDSNAMVPSLAGVDELSATLTYSATGKGDDGLLQFCWSEDGLNCSTAWADVPASGVPTRKIHPGDAVNGVDPALALASPVMNYVATVNRSGTVNVASDRQTVTLASGVYFNPNWKANSHIIIGGADCSIGALTGMTSLTLASNSCAASGTGQTYSAPNFGLMIRKKTTSTDAISVSAVTYQMNSSWAVEWGASGAFDVFSNVGYNGGYFSRMYAGSIGALYWTEPVSGSSHYLGLVGVNQSQGNHNQWGYQSWACGTSPSFDNTKTSNLTFYCIGHDAGNRPVLMQVVYSGATTANAPGTSANSSFILGLPSNCTQSTEYVLTCPGVGGFGVVTFTLLTPYYDATGAVVAHDLNSLLVQFDPTYVPGYFGFPSIASGPAGKIMLEIDAGFQDTLGNMAVFDPGNGDPTQAGTPNGPHVAGLNQCWKNPGCHWTMFHDVLPVGDVVMGHVVGNAALGSPTRRGSGPFVVTTNDPIPGSSGSLLVHINPQGTGANPYQPFKPQPCSSANNTACPMSETGLPGEWGNAAPGMLVCITARANGSGCNGNVNEIAQITAIDLNAGTYTLQRAFTTKGAIAIPGAGLKYITMWPDAQSPTQSSLGGIWWDAVNDPHGTAMMLDNANQETHEYYRENTFVESSNTGYLVRSGTVGGFFSANPLSVRSNPTFAGAVSTSGCNNCFNQHENFNGVLAGQDVGYDYRVFTGGGLQANGAFSLASGATSIWKATTQATDPDTLTGNINLTRRIWPTFAACGPHPLRDVSGPAPGAFCDGTSASCAYTYCVARSAGECQWGSASTAVGDVYVNCPYVTNPNCPPSSANGNSGNVDNEICIGDYNAYGHSVMQFSTTNPASNGETGRVLARMTGPGQVATPFFNARTTPDASWLVYPNSLVNGFREEILMAKLPPYPSPDGVDRSTFIPATVAVSNAPANTAAVRIKFGYAENGPATAYYCTTRQEACVKGNQPSNGYGFASDAIPGVPCTQNSGCSVAVPALAGHMLYYAIQFLDNTNALLQETGPFVIAVPATPRRPPPATPAR